MLRDYGNYDATGKQIEEGDGRAEGTQYGSLADVAREQPIQGDSKVWFRLDSRGL